MDKTLVLQHMYPNMTHKDYVVEDNGNGPTLKWFNKDVKKPTVAEMQIVGDQIEVEKNIELEKLEKKEAIEKIASTTDQINLIAGTLDVVVDIIAEKDPKILEHSWVIKSKEKLNEIKNILNK